MWRNGVIMDQDMLLTEFQRDALEEIGNIGMGNALTSLSKMVNKEVSINIPDLKFELIEDVPDLVGGADTIVQGVLLQIKGDFNGYIAIFFPAESASFICQTLTGTEDVDLSSEMNMSLMGEVGNILSGTYVSALSDFLNISVMISPPYATYDMTGAILDYILIEMSREVERVILLDTEFLVEGSKLNGQFMTLLDPASLKLLLSKIDAMV